MKDARDYQTLAAVAGYLNAEVIRLNLAIMNIQMAHGDITKPECQLSQTIKIKHAIEGTMAKLDAEMSVYAGADK